MTAWLAAILIMSADPQTLRLSGAVLLPDGKPASAATVVATCWHSPTVRVQADRDGRFTLAGEFAGPANLTALTADGKFGATLSIPGQSLRRRAAEPLLLKLTPARQVAVFVRKDGAPAAGVQVATSKDEPARRTDEQGRATFSFPAEEKNQRFSAWDPVRGVAGVWSESKKEASLTTVLTIDLQPTTPTTFKVVDESNRPIVGLKLSAGCHLSADAWFNGDVIPDSYGITNANGEWAVPWMPVKRQYPQAAPVDRAWVNDGADRVDDVTPGTLHVRKARRLKGRLTMPLGASPENLLIEGASFGSRDRMTKPAARVRADGSFELMVVSDHFYTIGVVDEEWTSTRHYGVLCRGDQSPPDVTLTGEYATTVEVRVVAGKDHKPVAGVWVGAGESGDKKWVDANNVKRTAEASLRQYGYTDEHGVARFGMGREPIRVSATHGRWNDEVKAKPPQSGPFEITLKKPFVDKLRVAGRIVPPPAAPGRVDLRAAADSVRGTPPFAVPVAADGAFSFESDDPKLILFATDVVGKTSAAAAVQGDGEQVVLKMLANGAYGGTAKKPDGAPLPGCKVTLFLDRGPGLFSRTVAADANGKFLVEDVPADQKLLLRLEPVGFKTRYLEHGEAYIEAGERYVDAVDVCSELPEGHRRERPFADRLETAISDARIWHAPALAVVTGSGQEPTELAKRLANDDAYSNAERWFCFPLRVTADQLAPDAVSKNEFDGRGWRMPAAGEVFFAAVSGDGKSLGHLDLKATDPDAVTKAASFLKQYEPAKTPAPAAFDAALAEAKTSNRRVFFQTGGLRCGPCYSFARWIDKHHAELDKDFVFIKLSNLHTDWEAVYERLDPKPANSQPWTAILDADGKVLVTSDSPIGNIGFPSSRLGIKHFRKMLDASCRRLTPAEREALLATLPKE